MACSASVARARGRGFTLLEVLVALVVVAVAVASLARVGSLAINGQYDNEQRTMALWVADNLIAEMRLETPGQTGRRQGSTRLGDRDWHWDALVQPTPGGDMLRVDVAVYRDRSRSAPILSHTGFLPL